MRAVVANEFRTWHELSPASPSNSVRRLMPAWPIKMVEVMSAGASPPGLCRFLKPAVSGRQRVGLCAPELVAGRQLEGRTCVDVHLALLSLSKVVCSFYEGLAAERTVRGRGLAKPTNNRSPPSGRRSAGIERPFSIHQTGASPLDAPPPL
eukprot:15458846-Alexandrium_andersonii.AAC.1